MSSAQEKVERVREMDAPTQEKVEVLRKELNDQEKEELDEMVKQGETVVPGGTGGKSLDAQQRIAEGRSRGGQTRRDQLGHEGYQELGHKGGEARRNQLGHEGYQEMGRKGGEARLDQMGPEGYQEMGRKGGLTTKDKSGEERAQKEGIKIDESKYKTKDG